MAQQYANKSFIYCEDPSNLDDLPSPVRIDETLRVNEQAASSQYSMLPSFPSSSVAPSLNISHGTLAVHCPSDSQPLFDQLFRTKPCHSSPYDPALTYLDEARCFDNLYYPVDLQSQPLLGQSTQTQLYNLSSCGPHLTPSQETQTGPSDLQSQLSFDLSNQARSYNSSLYFPPSTSSNSGYPYQPFDWRLQPPLDQSNQTWQYHLSHDDPHSTRSYRTDYSTDSHCPSDVQLSIDQSNQAQFSLYDPQSDCLDLPHHTPAVQSQPSISQSNQTQSHHSSFYIPPSSYLDETRSENSYSSGWQLQTSFDQSNQTQMHHLSPHTIPLTYLDGNSSAACLTSRLRSQPSSEQSDQMQIHDLSLSGSEPIPWIQPREIVVPQHVYRARGQKFVAQYQPIDFVFAGRVGMRLRMALERRYDGLHLRDSPVAFEGCGLTISVRIQMKGYKPWGRQIKMMNWCQPAKPITLAKLSTEVAKSVENFIKDNQDVEINPKYARWKVGPGALTSDCFTLKSLLHVSKSSFQPALILDNSHQYVLAGWSDEL